MNCTAPEASVEGAGLETPDQIPDISLSPDQLKRRSASTPAAWLLLRQTTVRDLWA